MILRLLAGAAVSLPGMYGMADLKPDDFSADVGSFSGADLCVFIRIVHATRQLDFAATTGSLPLPWAIVTELN